MSTHIKERLHILGEVRKSFKNEAAKRLKKNLYADMAGPKSKKPSALSKLYLASYNLGQTLGYVNIKFFLQYQMKGVFDSEFISL